MPFHRASVLALLMLSLGSAVAVADSNPLSPQQVAQNQQMPRRQGRNKESLLQELNLSQAQMQQIQQIRAKYKNQLTQQRQGVRQARQELSTLMAGTASADQIRAKHRELVNLRRQMEETQFNSMLEMREVMTPEQRSKFAQLMQQRRQKFRDKLGNMKGQQSLGI